jgi:hypothetical protein
MALTSQTQTWHAQTATDLLFMDIPCSSREENSIEAMKNITGKLPIFPGSLNGMNWPFHKKKRTMLLN